MRALRHPALGLALTIFALRALPQLVSPLVALVLGRAGMDPAEIAVFALPVAVILLQAATGWAIVRGRGAHLWFAAWFAACVAVAITYAIVLKGDFDALLVVGTGTETIGLPVLVAVLSLMFRDGELEPERSLGDVRALLLISFVGAVIGTAGEAVEIGHLMGPTASIGDWAGWAIWPAISLGVAIFGLVMAIRIGRGRGASAVRLYVWVAVGVHLATHAIGIVALLLQDWGPNAAELLPVLIAQRLVGLSTLLVPIAIWFYARDLGAGTEPVTRLPAWMAATLVPMLAARLLVSREVAAVLDGVSNSTFVALCATEATLILFGIEAAVRRRSSAGWWFAGAALGAVILVGGVVTYMATAARLDMVAFSPPWPLFQLAAATLVAAWLYRVRRVRPRV